MSTTESEREAQCELYATEAEDRIAALGDHDADPSSIYARLANAERQVCMGAATAAENGGLEMAEDLLMSADEIAQRRKRLSGGNTP